MRNVCLRILPVLAMIMTSCAGDIELVDRTQPGRIKKSALQGEWYFRQTVVDVPFTAGITFIGEQSVLERVRWEISEDFITAYRTYERVKDSEQPSTLPGTAYQGAPVAAFKILGHFDVIREYNAATGEQTNVLVENDTDRPWYERAYLRVDWSTNLLANFDFLAGGDEGLGVVTQAASYAVTDPNDPDAPVFGVKDGDGWTDLRDPKSWGELDTFDYFDLTLKLQVTPDTFLVWYDDDTTEEWPACWFYDEGPWDCASQTVKLRASFMRVPVSDYAPLYYPDNYIARDENGDAIRTMWDDGLGGLRRCNASESEYCTPVRIPMFDWFGYFRIEREAYDRDYELTEEGRIYLANRWNIWMKSHTDDGMVIPAKYRAPRTLTYYMPANMPSALMASSTGVVAEAWNEAFNATVNGVTGSTGTRPIFTVAPNTFRMGSGGIEDFGQRNGDLRYSHLYWVDDPQMEALLGYGPSAADPLSGEIVAADAYVYGGAVDSYAVMAADIIDLMRGDILTTEFIDGENVGNALAHLGTHGMNRAEMGARIERGMDQGLRQRLGNIKSLGKERFRGRYDMVASRLKTINDTPLADTLWNDEVKQAYEAHFGRRIPTADQGMRLLKALRKNRQKLGEHAVCLRDFEDAAVLGLVDQYKDLPRPEVIARVREAVYASTAIHEIGHTLGLRHNFAGSSDALNYFDKYWEVRDPAARALDLPTDTEMTGGVREYAYSSIMDYGAKFMSDIHGVGKYDRAAIKFGYGELLEAFVNPPYWEDHDVIAYYTLGDAIKNWMHYTALPALFESAPGEGDGIANMQARTDVTLDDYIAWQTLAPDAPDLTDTLVPYKFCSDEYAGAVWDCDMFDEGADPYEIVQYATQSYRDYYIFHAFKRNRRFIDPFEYYYRVVERTMWPISMQYHMWIWDQWYKSSEWDWLASEDAANGTHITTNPDWNLDPNGGLAFTAASMTALNFLSEVLSTPEPGSYFKDPDSGNLWWWTKYEDVICTGSQNSSVDACSDLYIPIGDGRYAISEFDADTGYYWYERVHVVGSFWEKVAAIETLSDPTTYFLGVDDVGNYSAYVLGFNVAFPKAVNTIFGAIINDDYAHYAPKLEADGSMTRPWVFDTVNAAYNDGVTPPRTGPFVDPATNFTVSLYAMYYGSALLNSSWEQTFNDSAKMYVEGSGEAFTPAAGAAVASFVNPYNNRTYHAVQMPDPGYYSLGYEMVTRAQAYADTLAARALLADTDPNYCAGGAFGTNDPCANIRWELTNLIENMELMRGYYSYFGYMFW